jgi:SAM-dependent methyltransferase
MAFADGGFDRALSMLVLNFIPDAPRAAAEMVRVTRPGGVVAAATWDLRGGLPVFRMFWDTAAVLDPEAEQARASYQSGQLTGPGELAALWRSLGLREVEQTSLMIRMEFENFDDYWAPLLGKTGPAGAYLDALPEDKRNELARWLRAAYLGGGADGPRSFAAVAWACRGRVPG